MSTVGLSAILPLAREGWRLFPLAPKAKTPAIGEWPNYASSDETRLTAWQSDYPACNWGMATGAGSGVFVVDIDGETGSSWFAEQLRTHGDEWAQTRKAKTRRGLHLFFAWPRNGVNLRNSAGKIAAGVDLRAEGGYVVIPPSIHPSGSTYEWLTPPTLAPISPPDWLLALATSASKSEASPAVGDVSGVIPQGQRNDVLTSLAGSMRRRGMTQDAIAAALLVENRRCAPPLPFDEVQQIAASVAAYPPQPALLPEGQLTEGDCLTQDDLAEALVQREPDVRYCARIGRWYLYDGSVWREDETRAIYNRTKELMREFRAQFSKTRMARETARTYSAVEQIASAHPRYAITVDELDAHPDLLNTPSGTIERDTGAVRPSRAEDYLTMTTCVAPDGDCPLWHVFLKKVTAGDQALEDFLQRLSFYCLWGSVTQDAIFYIFGVGSNGKSTFITNLAGAIGDYAVSAPAAVFMRSAHEQHPTGLAKLRGARLVFTSEIPDGSWNEEFLKSISGGGKLSARFMRGDFFDFEPTFKLLLAGNYKPQLRSVDPAMRRRFNLIPFTATFSEEEIDRDLRDVKLPRERSGILAWALAGRAEFMRQGLNPPPVVRSATAEYLGEEDLAGRWFDECCVVAPGRRENAGELYRSFSAWAEAEGENFVPKKKWLGRELKKRGFVPQNDGRVRWWIGLELKAEKASY